MSVIGEPLSSNLPLIPFKLKKFITASLVSDESSQQSSASASPSTGNGQSISDYYINITGLDEGMVSSSNSADISICDEVVHINKCENKFKNIEQSLLSKALKFAQYNDVENLQKMIDLGVSINATDEYGWSLLMIASCAGSDRVVKYLIGKNARKGRRDSKGNTALYLACKNNHNNVIDLLIKNKSEKPSTSHPSSYIVNNYDANSSYLCEICDVVVNCPKIQHISSIAHLFKEGSLTSKPMYGIPRSNLGYQMLLQQGWDDQEGLGPSGSGRHYPIKSKQKQDRAGIGRNSKDAAISPFKRKEKSHSLSLKSVRKSIHQEKLKERELRKILNGPDLV